MEEKKMSFEEAFKRLKEISKEMDSEELPLEKAVGLYSEAAKLTAFCKSEIENAKIEIDKIEKIEKIENK